MISGSLFGQCDAQGDISIQENYNVTWNSAPNGGQLVGKVIVKKGATLTINAPITFGLGGAVYVYGGGKVILNSVLTACDRWDGVRVFGDKEGGEGVFEANLGSEIEHAVWGISTTQWEEFLGRGRIECNETIFRNNGVAVMLATMNRMDDKCQSEDYSAAFYDCKFFTDNNLRHEKFWAFMTVYNLDVSPLIGYDHVVNGCEFLDEQTNSTHGNKTNTGIVALNGSVDVIYSTFENLYYGIETRRCARNFTTFVDGTDFDKCVIGIHNVGMSSPVFTNNIFDLKDAAPFSFYKNVGILLEDGMGRIKVQDNHFVSSLDNPKLTVGIYVNSIGEGTNKIRRNQFYKIEYANVAVGSNANSEKGLYYLCNKNVLNSRIDFLAVGDLALREEQGLVNLDGDDYYPAGNTFSTGGYDFLNLSPELLNYYYDESLSFQTPDDDEHFGLNVWHRNDNGHCANAERRSLDELKDAIAAKTLDSPSPIVNIIEVETDYQTHWEAYQEAKIEYADSKVSGSDVDVKAKKAKLLFESEQCGELAGKGYYYAQTIELL